MANAQAPNRPPSLSAAAVDLAKLREMVDRDLTENIAAVRGAQGGGLRGRAEHGVEGQGACSCRRRRWWS
jgi:hypothetical protein